MPSKVTFDTMAEVVVCEFEGKKRLCGKKNSNPLPEKHVEEFTKPKRSTIDLMDSVIVTEEGIFVGGQLLTKEKYDRALQGKISCLVDDFIFVQDEKDKIETVPTTGSLSFLTSYLWSFSS